MKNILVILISFLICIAPLRFICSQELGEPFIIHSLIGDKLDRVEEEYFNLLPMIEDFQEAKFYINADSTIRVIVFYESNGFIKDTLIQNYSHVAHVRNFIDQKLASEINDRQNIFKGNYASTTSLNDIVAEVELLSIKNDSIPPLNIEGEKYINNTNSSFGVSYNQFSSFNKLMANEKTNIAKYIYPVGIGLTAMFIYKSTIDSESSTKAVPYREFGQAISEASEKALTYALISIVVGGLGCLVGYVLSDVFPIWIEIF